jgi:hypothetical protein
MPQADCYISLHDLLLSEPWQKTWCRTNTSADFQIFFCSVIRHGVVLGQSKNVAKFMVGAWAGVDIAQVLPGGQMLRGGQPRQEPPATADQK